MFGTLLSVTMVTVLVIVFTIMFMIVFGNVNVFAVVTVSVVVMSSNILK